MKKGFCVADIAIGESFDMSGAVGADPTSGAEASEGAVQGLLLEAVDRINKGHKHKAMDAMCEAVNMFAEIHNIHGYAHQAEI